MELIISLALGAWIFIGGWVSYKSMKKEQENKPANTDKVEGGDAQ